MESDLRVEVPSKYNVVLKDGMQVTLGVRPTDVLISANEASSTAVPVALFEDLGDERRVGVRVGKSFFILRPEAKFTMKKGSCCIWHLPENEPICSNLKRGSESVHDSKC
jgi:multiple sugar transport system ATP-binding protein